MPDCPKLPKCIFFNDQMADMPGMAGSMKKSYCQGCNTACARWMLVSRDIPVPADLYPHQIDRAMEIIAEAANKSPGSSDGTGNAGK